MVQPKYSPEDALQRVKLMMGYDLKKSLRENIKSTGAILNEQDGSGVGPEEAVNIAYEIYSEMAGDVESEDLNDVINILKSKVIGQTWDEGGCLLSKVIEYYKTQSGKSSWSWGGMTTGDLIKDITNSKEAGEAQFNDVKKRLLSLINTELAGFCKTGAKKDDDKKDDGKKDDGKKDDGKEVVKKGGGSGYKSKYTPCTPGKYVRGCKSEVVRKVQACLKQAPKHQTGNFGPITQGNLQKLGKGFENGFTDADVATICQTETVKKLGNDVESQTLGQDMASDTNIPSNPNQQDSTTKTGIS